VPLDELPVAPPGLEDGLAVLPLEGEPPLDGGVALDERDGAEPLPPEPWLEPDEPELSQAASERAAKAAVAISHFLSIGSSPYRIGCVVAPASSGRLPMRPKTGVAARKFRVRIFTHERADRPLTLEFHAAACRAS
jgi:hypothetical protein